MSVSVRQVGNLSKFWQRQDERYFLDHLDRKAHIRNAHQGEMEGEFWSLGPHEKKRRRIVLLRVDFEGVPFPDNKVLKVPLIAFADETIEDTDEILLPMMKEIMEAEAKRQGLVK